MLSQSNIDYLRANFCHESEGRARLKDASGNHLFGFESSLNSRMWRVLVDIPFKGQEEIVFELPKSSSDSKFEISGSAASKFRSILKKDKSLSSSFELFIGLMLALAGPDSAMTCDQGSENAVEKCRNDTMFFTMKLDGEKIELNNFSNGKTLFDMQVILTKGNIGFEKLFVTMRNETSFATDLNMFLNHCVVRK